LTARSPAAMHDQDDQDRVVTETRRLPLDDEPASGTP
jgi:hypothetical protein